MLSNVSRQVATSFAQPAEIFMVSPTAKSNPIGRKSTIVLVERTHVLTSIGGITILAPVTQVTSPLVSKISGASPKWTATTAFTIREVRDAATGSVVRPTDDSGQGFNDRHFKCTTAGTSGGTEPTWNLTIGGDNK